MDAKEIRSYMRHEVSNHIDPRTSEVNMTGLAEEACMSFLAYEGERMEIPELFFELAFEVAEEYDQVKKARNYLTRRLNENAQRYDWDSYVDEVEAIGRQDNKHQFRVTFKKNDRSLDWNLPRYYEVTVYSNSYRITEI